MDKIIINSNNGFICSILDSDLTLGRLIYLIKFNYPQVEDDEIQIINKGKVLDDDEKRLSDLGVLVNIDRLIIIPATIWKKIEQK